MANNAVLFDGVNQYGEVSSNSLIDNMTDGVGTVEGWVWNDPASAPYSVAFSADDGGSLSIMKFTTENGTGNEGLNFKYDYGAGTDADGYSATSYLKVSQWVHVALVWFLNSPSKVYINGVEITYNLQQTPVGTPTAWDTTDVHIAMDRFAGYWKGGIGGFFRLWKTSRTLWQIMNNKDYNLESAVEPDLVINLKFLEGAGATIANESNPSYPCNLVNSPSWTTGPNIYPRNYMYREKSFKNNLRPKAFAPGFAR